VNLHSSICGNEGSSTSYHLPSLEKRISTLYASLWRSGHEQKICGKQNKLVEITDHQAAELAAIVQGFDYGIKDTMTFMGLSTSTDRLSQMAITRSTVKLKGNFKQFSNLPISTKFRYIRCRVQSKQRRIQHHINAIKRVQLISRHMQISDKEICSIFSKWRNTINTRDLEKEIKDIYEDYITEWEERENNVKAIHHKSPKGNASDDGTDNMKSRCGKENFIRCLPERTIKLINFWLTASNCKQMFHRSLDTDRIKTLRDTVSSWKESLMEISTDVNHNTNFDVDLARLEKACDALTKYEGQLGAAQKQYRDETVLFLIRTNSIKAFTRKVSPKPRDLPTAHSEIWDQKLQKFRACHNEYEELLATGAHHGHWMDNSAAEENCAFASIKRKGLLGARGINLSPTRKVSYEDIPKLIHKGAQLPKSMQKAFINAHGEHTARLFQPPEKDHAELFYPFFLQNEEGVISEENEIKEFFIKGIVGIPGKARYEGFHMAVVGRFGSKWQDCLFNIIKLILVMRFIPKQLRKIARFPIPKPGKANEYRPISLCHDIYCFVNGISTTYSSRGIQKAGILHQGITAYVKGKGCTTLVGVEQGIREDVIESGKPLSQTDEDEEKFFDRISVEVLLAAMRVNGFPTQGFLELKASGMESKTVEIFTNKGVAHAKFTCGLEQGNPDSPTIANLVIKFKHDIWLNILRESSNIQDNKCEEKSQSNIKVQTSEQTFNVDAYKMHIVDPEDGVVEVDRIGYCDDNSRYTCSLDENEVIKNTAKYIQFAGDLSLVTKIGRKGSKSETHYFNLTAETALALKEVESIAWSFQLDGPKIEKVPFKIYLQHEEESKAFRLAKFHEMNELDKEKFLLVFKPSAHKHLGLRSTLGADSSEASSEVMNKIKARVSTLNIHNMERQSQQLCANMLCNSMHSYATLQMNHKCEDLQECDNLLIQKIRKRHGLSESDAKHPLFIQESQGGYGFKSFLDTDLIATARELEIVLNGGMIDSRVIRSRTRSYLLRHDRPNSLVFRNFIGTAISKIAKYGFHLRDTKDDIVNYIFSILCRQKRFQSIGSGRYSDGKTNHSSGRGNETNLKIAFGSQLHFVLRQAITDDGKLRENIILPEDAALPTSLRVIERSLMQAKEIQFSDRTSTYNCWEWDGSRMTATDAQLLDPSHWKKVDVSTSIKRKYPLSYWKLSSIQIHQMATEILSLANRPHIMRRITTSLGPAFIATDGAHRNVEDSSKNIVPKYSTNGAAVLCLIDTREGEDFKSAKWIHRKSTPIFARAATLPNSIGTDITDIAHGETIGVCLGLEMMNNSTPSVLVMDSLAVREIVLNLRDRKRNQSSDRNHIRKEISGISKCLCSRLMRSFQQNIDGDTAGEAKVEEFLRMSKLWTAINRNDEGDIQRSWAGRYWDSHRRTPIIKVDSHQLAADGGNIKNNPRYPTLLPNFFLLHCNHLADKCADMLYKQQFQKVTNIPDIILPESNLRFVLTWNGKAMDRHIAHIMTGKFQLERISRLQKRATQGLPWRMLPLSNTSWKEFRSWGGLNRSLRGFTNSHTRGLYKSITCRNGLIRDYLEKDKEENGELRDKTAISMNTWIQTLAPCSWCPNHDKVKGNRFHTLFFCQHEDLVSFRSNMYVLQEQKLTRLMDAIRIATDAQYAESFIQKIESTMYSLHGVNKEDDTAHRIYRDRKTWVEEEGEESWELMQATSMVPIYGHIFGLIPVQERLITSDMELSRGDAIALGLIPIEITKEFKDMSKGLYKFSPCTNHCATVRGGLWKLWDEIVEIHRLTLTGLHQIAGDISKKRELHFKKKVKADETNLAKEKVNARPTSILRKKRSLDAQDANRCKKVRFADKKTMKIQKKCTGITCNGEFRTWNTQTKMANNIDFNKKHCVRCSKQQTAIKKCIVILEEKEKEAESTKDIKNITEYLDTSINKHDYKRGADIFNLASSRITTKQLSGKRGNKRGVPDPEKLVINTLGKSIARNTDKSEHPQKRICQAKINLVDTNQRVNEFLKTDLKRNIADVNKISQRISYDKKLIKITRNSKDNQPPLCEKIWSSQKANNQDDLDELATLRKYEYMEGRIMNKAILNLRYSAPRNIFIANADASVAMAGWEKSKGWAAFAGSFRSVYVSSNKPNGVYLIPIFSGPSEAGHWTLAVIHKQTKSCRGWIIDSLGTGNTSSNLARTIKEAFSKSKIKCRWQPSLSKAQTEAECGTRVVLGMVSICEMMKNMRSIDKAVEEVLKGTLWSGLDYQPRVLREKAAEWIRVSEEAIRLQQQSNVEMATFRRKQREKVTEKRILAPRVEVVNVDEE